MPAWIIFVQWTEIGVLIVLLGLSVWSVSIMIDRKRLFKAQENKSELSHLVELIQKKSPSDELLAFNKKKGSLRHGTLETILKLKTHDFEPIDRAVKSYLNTERLKFEKDLTVLATLGSNAPFIGLFGTVLGIIQSFGQLSGSQQNTAGVMAGISVALVATAIGLFVAIPAVVAYNYFSKQLRNLFSECEIIKDSYLAHYGRKH